MHRIKGNFEVAPKIIAPNFPGDGGSAGRRGIREGELMGSITQKQ